ncbi:MAG: sulfite reductase flavoprotein subunit alpha [Cyanobacteria bacterium P01_F01_bin.143]
MTIQKDNVFERTILAFGSESGNAERITKRLSAKLQQQSQDISYRNLNSLNLAELNANDLLLVITSTFGDGAPPGNARAFSKDLAAIAEVCPFQYAVFGLGDVEYPKFCQFGKTVDISLAEKGARRLVNRVDADLDYQYFFSHWEQCISDIIAGKRSDGLGLNLKVEAYSESCPYLATIDSVEQISSSSEGIYHVNLNIRNSGMNYRAGDLLYVLPEDDAELYSEFSDWFGQDEDISLLAGKELRRLNKSLLRSLANASGNSQLKENLKIKNKSALADYLYGRDLLDVLKDCGESGFISVAALANILSLRRTRVYLIASCGAAEGGSKDNIHLCVRDVTYQAFGRNHNGSASHSLCQAKSGDKLKIFVRSNPDFWLDSKQNSPVLMIGEGTGIAPYIGFLNAIANGSKTRDTMLILGERYQAREYLYQSKLTEWLEKDVLNRLETSFSPDQENNDFMQKALLDAASDIYQMLDKDGHVYICGSKKILDKPVDKALKMIIQNHEVCSESEANKRLHQLYEDERIHKNIY